MSDQPDLSDPSIAKWFRNAPEEVRERFVSNLGKPGMDDLLAAARDAERRVLPPAQRSDISKQNED
jgi:hypothetical protein